MLLDFTVGNFRSLRVEQKLSFVASNYIKEVPENVFEAELPGLDGVKVLKGVAIYGANAAGKTNVLLALRFLADFVVTSATRLDEGDPIEVEPFALAPDDWAAATEFVLRFVADGVRYHFALTLNHERVLFESLSAFPNGVEQKWYERCYNPKTKRYAWSPKRSTHFDRDPALVSYTRSNALFLSTAAKWNNEQLAPIYRWFKQQLRFLALAPGIAVRPPIETIRIFESHDRHRADILSLLRHADLGIVDAEVSHVDIDRAEIPANLPEEMIAKILKQKRWEVTLAHRGRGGENFSLNLADESAGTRALFALAGPWIELLSKEIVVAVDELETSFHPLVVAELLRLFFSRSRGATPGQILFTTQSPLLLDINLLRRDQIWFAEKDNEGATHLYPLTDYKVRKGESVIRGYLSGRYGGVPWIPAGLLGAE